MKLKQTFIIIFALILTLFIGYNLRTAQIGSFKSVLEPGSVVTETEHHSPPSVVIEPGSAVETASYIIFHDDETPKNYYAKSGDTGEIVKSSDNASEVIQHAIDQLTDGRTWNEVVSLKGNFTINGTIKIPSYTTLEMYGANLILGFDGDMFQTSSLTDGQRNIKMLGGTFYGDKYTRKAGNCFRGNLYFSTFRDMYISEFRENGIHIEAHTGQRARSNFFTNLHIRQNRQNGIYFQGVEETVADMYIVNCHIVANGNNGLQPYDGIHAERAGHITVLGGIIEQNYHDIHLVDAANSRIEGVEIATANRSGIRMEVTGNYPTLRGHHTIIGNTFGKNGQEGVNQYDDIYGTGYNDTNTLFYVKVIGNTFRMNSNTRYGVNFESYEKYNLISENTFNNPGTAGVNKVSLDTIVSNNIGYTTENSGVASSITDGAWVEHNLASTPNIVTLTPRSNAVVWVNSRNETHFQIGVSTGTVTVDWYAEV